MELQKKNIAYDFSLFEVVPKKEEKNNVIKLPKNKVRSKVHPLNFLLSVFLSITGVAIIVMMIYSQVNLMELTEKINKANKTLNESKSMYTQLEMKVDSQLSLAAVENYAKNVLNMRKISPYQVEYVNLSEGDKSEIDEQSSKENILEKVKDIFANL